MILSLFAVSQDKPWLDENNPAVWSDSDSLTYRSQAGIVVTPQSALGLPAYFACIRVLSEDTAKLPILVNRNLGKGESDRPPDSSAPSSDQRHPSRQRHAFSLPDSRGSLSGSEHTTATPAAWARTLVRV